MSELADSMNDMTARFEAIRDDLDQQVRERTKEVVRSEQLASVGFLAAGVAHEINNPLAYVLANLDCMTGQLTSFRSSVDPAAMAEVEAELADVRVGAERIRSIVQDLNTFSRGSRPDEMSPLDVKRSIEFALKVAGNEIRHRARIVAELADTPPVLGSEARLAQVFLNLLLSAAHAIPEGAAGGNEVRVVSRAESAPSRVVVEISDTGTPIPEQELAHLFEPFYAGKSTGRGSGFGLPISLGTVRAMGGDLSVERRPGAGTLFRVVLPVQPRSRRQAAPKPAPDLPAGGGTILVIDDEPRVAAAIQRCLSARHQVSVAASAAEALQQLGGGTRYDAIVCDLMMPDMSGMEFYAELEARLPELAKRVVFMTGGAFTPRAQQFLSRVESRCIGKPIDFAALEAMVAGVMQ
jgi:nitrogen-specific signal transduction histidine kinase